MDLRRLSHFVAAVQAGNMSRAAEQVFLSQPALSRSIATLEADLGIVLLERGRKGVALTGDGAAVYKVARASLDLFEAQDRLIRDVAAGVRGTIVGAIGPSLMGTAFVESLKTALRSYPDISIRIVASGDIVGQRQQVADGSLDFYFAMESPLATNDSLDIDVLGTRYPLVWMVEDHPLADRAHLDPADIEPYPVYSGTAWRSVIDRWASDDERRMMQAKIEVDDEDVIWQLARGTQSLVVWLPENKPPGFIARPWRPDIEAKLGAKLVGYRRAENLMSTASQHVYGIFRRALVERMTNEPQPPM